jgi:hypothetical protein
MAKNFPEATRGRGCTNILIVFMLMAALIGILWAVLFWGFKQSAGNSLFLSWAILALVACVYTPFSWFQSMKKAGRVLLDLMPHPSKTLTLFSGIIFIVIGFLGAFDFMHSGSIYSWLFSSLIGLGGGTYQIVMAYSHLRVHENGVMAYRTLVKWEKIESFRWVPGNGKMDTLKLKYKGRIPRFMREGALPVPVEKRPELESILEKYLSGALPST